MRGNRRNGTRSLRQNIPPRNPVDLHSAREKKENETVLERPNNVRLKKREFILLAFFTLALFFMLYRVGYIQFVKGEEYQKMAYANQTQKRQITPKRGTIYDRNGNGLAISASVNMVEVNPKGLRDEVGKNAAKLQEIADKLAGILNMNAADILKIFNKNSRFEYVKRKIDRDVGNTVRTYVNDAGITNIYVDEDSKRYYPNGSLASHVLGFVGIDDQGLTGIELSMDSTLKGIPGKIMNEVDVLGRQINYNPERYVDAIDGYNVYLTIDETIQHFAEKALEQAILDDKVLEGAGAVVMDPNTGEVLAMASAPDFNPNQPDAKPAFVDDPDWKGFKSVEDATVLWETVFRNKTLMDTYEPGSTFKSITLAAALEEGVVNPSTPFVCKSMSLSGWTINCWRRGGHGSEDFTHAVYNSCNPVFAQVAVALGKDKFYQYVRMFGFQKRTGIELSGEPSDQEYGNLWHKDPKEIDIAVSGFGQRFQMSAIQLATAYCAIANGGNLMKPTIIKQITDGDGNIIKKNEPVVVRKVLSETTSLTERTILEGVVSEGTGQNAYISGYKIAGKTGTSQTLQTESKGRYVVSFVAMAPADKPRIVVLVMLDHPDIAKNLVTGGILAAPVAGKLCEEILEYLQVERQYSEKDLQELTEEVFVPQVTGLTVKEAGDKLKAYGLKYMVEGLNQAEDAVVYDQTPKADFSVPLECTVILYTDKEAARPEVEMPNLINKTVSEATAAMKKLGLNIRITGDGSAMKQQYPPGTKLNKGEVVDVDFRALISD